MASISKQIEALEEEGKIQEISFDDLKIGNNYVIRYGLSDTDEPKFFMGHLVIKNTESNPWGDNDGMVKFKGIARIKQLYPTFSMRPSSPTDILNNSQKNPVEYFSSHMSFYEINHTLGGKRKRKTRVRKHKKSRISTRKRLYKNNLHH